MGTGNVTNANSPNDKTAKTVDLYTPISLTFNSDKTILYVANYNAHNVIGYNFTQDKTFLVAGTGTGGYSGDGGLAIDAKLAEPLNLYFEKHTGMLYFGNSGNIPYRIINMNSGIISSGPRATRSVSAGPTGEEWIADSFKIYYMALSGYVSNFAGTGGYGWGGEGIDRLSQQFFNINIIWVDYDAVIYDQYDVYVATQRRIFRISNITGKTYTIIGTGSPKLVLL